jgi:hypothetical protein
VSRLHHVRVDRPEGHEPWWHALPTAPPPANRWVGSQLEPILIGVSEELVEVVTAAGKTTAIVSRGDVLAGNLWHRTAFVIVRSSTGAVLAHRRAETKRIAPGKWDLGFGGAVRAGESFEAAAARELLEEAGISTPIHFVGDYVYDGSDSRESAACSRPCRTGRSSTRRTR